MRRKLTSLGPCSRCKRGTFRESLPIVTVVQQYNNKPNSVQSAQRGLMVGQAHGMPLGMTEAMMPTDVELELAEGEAYEGGEAILCMRCTVALRTFMEGLTEDEEREYTDIDEGNELLRELKAR